MAEMVKAPTRRSTRAKYIAETFLQDIIQYNNVRSMLGFTEHL